MELERILTHIAAEHGDAPLTAVALLTAQAELEAKDAAQAAELERERAQKERAEAERQAVELASRPKPLPVRLDPEPGDVAVFGFGIETQIPELVSPDGTRYFVEPPKDIRASKPCFVPAWAAVAIERAQYSKVIALAKLPHIGSTYASESGACGIGSAGPRYAREALKGFVRECKSDVVLLAVLAAECGPDGDKNRADIVLGRLSTIGLNPFAGQVPDALRARVRELWGLEVPTMEPRGPIDESSLETTRQLSRLHARRVESERSEQGGGSDAA